MFGKMTLVDASELLHMYCSPQICRHKHKNAITDKTVGELNRFFDWGYSRLFVLLLAKKKICHLTISPGIDGI